MQPDGQMGDEYEQMVMMQQQGEEQFPEGGEVVAQGGAFNSHMQLGVLGSERDWSEGEEAIALDMRQSGVAVG